MNLFDYLDSGKKYLLEDEKKDFIKVVANTFLDDLRSIPGGIEQIMNHEVKRRQLLYYLYGAIDRALLDFGRNKLFDSKNTEGLLKENNLIWDYFQEELGYRIEEVMNIVIVCSDVQNPNEILGFDRNAMHNLVVNGGNALNDWIEQVRHWISISKDKEEEEYYKNSASAGGLLGLLAQDY